MALIFQYPAHNSRLWYQYGLGINGAPT